MKHAWAESLDNKLTLDKDTMGFVLNCIGPAIPQLREALRKKAENGCL